MKALILGRPNVGKSSLFNRITQSRKALVFKESGITRDILIERVTWENQTFEIMDSGGLPEETKKSELLTEVKKKLLSAIQEADIFICVTDGQQGVRPADVEVVNLIRKTEKPFVLFVNKVDDPKKEDVLKADFFCLTSQVLSGSCERNHGMSEVLNWIVSRSMKKTSPLPSLTSHLKEKRTELFIMGKANSGKSLLCNQILNKDRMIVSSLPGTTLDTVRDIFSKDSEEFAVSDNPGMRRGTREEREKLSFAKSRTAANRADIVLLVSDGTKGIGRQEARLTEICLRRQKPVILIVNKLDLFNESAVSKKEIQDQINKIFRFYPDIPVVYMSAKTGKNKRKLFDVISEINRKIRFRVSTPKLNNFFLRVIRKAPAPVYGTSDVKFFYITQTHKVPPSFIAFANYPKGVTPAYKRFIVSRIKKQWSLQGIPVEFHALPRN